MKTGVINVRRPGVLKDCLEANPEFTDAGVHFVGICNRSDCIDVPENAILLVCIFLCRVRYRKGYGAIMEKIQA